MFIGEKIGIVIYLFIFYFFIFLAIFLVEKFVEMRFFHRKLLIKSKQKHIINEQIIDKLTKKNNNTVDESFTMSHDPCCRSPRM